MARRYKSLHHNLQEGENVVFHREHRSKKGRRKRTGHWYINKEFKHKKKYEDIDNWE